MLKIQLGDKMVDVEKQLNYLEELRQSGKTNMYGATPYLQKRFGLSHENAKAILIYWMNNYNALCEKYNWR